MALILLVVLGIVAIIVLNILKAQGVSLPGVRLVDSASTCIDPPCEPACCSPVPLCRAGGGSCFGSRRVTASCDSRIPHCFAICTHSFCLTLILLDAIPLLDAPCYLTRPLWPTQRCKFLCHAHPNAMRKVLPDNQPPPC